MNWHGMDCELLGAPWSAKRTSQSAPVQAEFQGCLSEVQSGLTLLFSFLSAASPTYPAPHRARHKGNRIEVHGLGLRSKTQKASRRIHNWTVGNGSRHLLAGLLVARGVAVVRNVAPFVVMCIQTRGPRGAAKDLCRTSNEHLSSISPSNQLSPITHFGKKVGADTCTHLAVTQVGCHVRELPRREEG